MTHRPEVPAFDNGLEKPLLFSRAPEVEIIIPGSLEAKNGNGKPENTEEIGKTALTGAEVEPPTE